MLQQQETLQGLEVLHFEQVELSKLQNGIDSFIDTGNLAVIYLPSQDCFLLQLKDWNYILDKEFSVFSPPNNLQNSRSYTFPCDHTFFTLKLNKIEDIASIQNLETIINSVTTLSYQDSLPTGCRAVFALTQKGEEAL